MPIVYRDIRLDCGFRADFVIDDALLVELKCVDALAPIHHAQIITYLKLLGLKQGLLINFKVLRLVDGVKSFLM